MQEEESGKSEFLERDESTFLLQQNFQSDYM